MDLPAKAPPHNPEAEAALVGAMLLDSAVAADVLRSVKPEHFWLDRPRAIYNAVARLRERSAVVDLVTVKAELGDGFDVSYLASTVENVPSASAWRDYARIVRKHAKRRRLVELSRAVTRQAESGHELNGELTELAEAGKQLAEDGADDAIQPATSAVELITQELSPLEYVLRPLASIGNFSIIQGEPKGGKSCFALLVAVAASLGKWMMGRFESDLKPRPVLFVTYEDGKRRLRQRIRQYVNGLGDPLNPLVPVNLMVYSSDNAPRIRLDDGAGVYHLKAVIRRHGAKLVVLDTLSHLTGADENSKKEMQPVMDALKDAARELQCAIIVLHHTGKPGKDGSKSIVYRSRGSSAIAAAADVILDWGDRAGTNITPCSLISKDDDGDKFCVEYMPDGDDIVRWRLVDPEPEDDKYGSRKSIIEALGKLIVGYPQGVSRAQIVKATNLTKNTVVRHLSELLAEGSINGKQADLGNGSGWVYSPITHPI